MSDLPD